MSKTTFDLSTLDLTVGSHAVKVKAKANGYADSEFSNEVSYTKQSSAGYYITFAHVAYDYSYVENVYIRLNGTGDWIEIPNDGELLEYDDVKYIQMYYVAASGVTVNKALCNTDGGYPDIEDPSLSQYDFTSSTSIGTAITIPVTEQCDFVVTVFEADNS